MVNIKKFFLFVPVEILFFFNNGEHEKLIEPRYPVDDILFLNARKSYQWRWLPPKIPFIPFFGLHSTQVKFDNESTLLSSAELLTMVKNSISEYNLKFLQDFNSYFRYLFGGINWKWHVR